MKERTLKIIQSLNKDEVRLCSYFCDWNNCDMPKWICLNCGHVECESCLDDWNNLVMLEEQFGEVYPCRKCHCYNTTDEFPNEWKNRKELKLEWDSDFANWRIAESEWEEYWKQYPLTS